ncbi:MAG: hypothetical protein HQ472_04065 [Ignavibacteria bacterium]|nr:hypothetical protein [Ignavibacteria bacterium]
MAKVVESSTSIFDIAWNGKRADLIVVDSAKSSPGIVSVTFLIAPFDFTHTSGILNVFLEDTVVLKTRLRIDYAWKINARRKYRVFDKEGFVRRVKSKVQSVIKDLDIGASSLINDSLRIARKFQSIVSPKREFQLKWPDFLYFSFGAMSLGGYGDIAPVGTRVRMFVLIQHVILTCTPNILPTEMIVW